MQSNEILRFVIIFSIEFITFSIFYFILYGKFLMYKSKFSNTNVSFRVLSCTINLAVKKNRDGATV